MIYWIMRIITAIGIPLVFWLFVIHYLKNKTPESKHTFRFEGITGKYIKNFRTRFLVDTIGLFLFIKYVFKLL